MHEGTCVGGPLDGLTYTIRSDGGFLAVDKPAGLAWLYAKTEDGTFVVVTNGDVNLVDPVTGARPLDDQRAMSAWADTGLDVVAVPDNQLDESVGDLDDDPAEQQQAGEATSGR